MNAQETSLAIQILGMNDSGLESGNSAISTGRVLPWLQPAGGQDVWTPWEVTYRDVVILGPANERLGVFNVTVNDLSVPANYAALKAQLLEAADK